MQNLSMKHRCIIGFILFSMFFGAGNLIFPPLLGAQACAFFHTFLRLYD